jgi:nucleoside-diphosphate-sugar epimerase
MLKHLNAKPVKPARVVVMGAGGFIGGAIVGALKKAAISTLALTRKEVDLLAPDAADRLANYLKPEDAFVAVSAIAPVKTVAMLADNMVMVRAMVGALNKVQPAHVLNIGSDAVFADGPLPLVENSPRSPESLHGVMHLARELAFAAEVKAPQATLRPTLVYGAGDPHGGYGPNRFRRLANTGKDIVLFGNGEERRDHVLVDDVADLAVRILLHRSEGSLNAVTGQTTSFRNIAEQVVAESKSHVAITPTLRNGPMPHGGYRPFDPAACVDSFPDFRFTPLAEGLALAQLREFPASKRVG